MIFKCCRATKPLVDLPQTVTCHTWSKKKYGGIARTSFRENPFSLGKSNFRSTERRCSRACSAFSMAEACRPFGLSIASRANSTAASLDENGKLESKGLKAFRWRATHSTAKRPTSLDRQKGKPNVYVHPPSSLEPIRRSPSHFTPIGS